MTSRISLTASWIQIATGASIVSVEGEAEIAIQAAAPAAGFAGHRLSSGDDPLDYTGALAVWARGVSPSSVAIVSGANVQPSVAPVAAVAPAVTTPPSMAPANPTAGGTVTISLGAASGVPTPKVLDAQLVVGGERVAIDSTPVKIPRAGAWSLNVVWGNGVAPNAVGSASGTVAAPAGASAPAQMAAPTLTGGADQATLAFAAAPSNGGSAITGYGWQITLASDPTFAAPVAVGSQATRANVTVTGLAAGIYIAHTWAINGISPGLPSPASAAATVTAGSGPIAILLLGQSNMVGRRVSDGAFTLPAGVFALTAANALVEQTGNSMLPFPDPFGAAYYTPTVQYLTALKAGNPTRDIHVIPCAEGGTDFHGTGGGWSAGGPQRAYMDARLSGYAALPGAAVSIDHILHVGHEYAGDDLDYWEDMSAFVDYVRTRPGCSATTPFVLTYTNSTSGVADSEAWVRYVNESVVKSRPCMAALDTSDLVPMEATDPYHYTLPNYKVLDTRWASAVAAAKAATVAPGSGVAGRGEWFFGTDNALFQAGQPGSRNPALVLTEAANVGVNSAGYYTQAAVAAAAGFTAPFNDDTEAATFVLVYRPGAGAAGLLGCLGAGLRLRVSINGSLGVTPDAGPNPFAGNAAFNGLLSTTNFNMLAICVANDRRSGMFLMGTGAAQPVEFHHRGVPANTRIPSGGAVQLGNIARAGTGSGSYPNSFDLAYFGAWTGKMLMPDLLALRNSLAATLAARGVTLA